MGFNQVVLYFRLVLSSSVPDFTNPPEFSAFPPSLMAFPLGIYPFL